MKVFAACIYAALAFELAGQIDSVAAEVQRIPDEFFMANSSWIEDWKFRHFRKLNADSSSVACMIIIKRDDSWETVALLEENKPSPIQNPGALSPHQYKAIHIGPQPDFMSSRMVAKIDATNLIRDAWELVENADLNSQGGNILSSNNEVWYLLSRSQDGPFILNLAQGINPPESGKLKSLYKSLISD